MNISDWVVISLTITLIVITIFYAWQTFRLATTAANEADDRRSREKESAARFAAALLAETRAMKTDVDGILDQCGNEGIYKVGPVDRFYVGVSSLARSRVFYGLLTQLGELPTDNVLRVVDVYGLVDSISDRAREFLSRPGTYPVSGGETVQLFDDLKSIRVQLDLAVATLLE